MGRSVNQTNKSFMQSEDTEPPGASQPQPNRRPSTAHSVSLVCCEQPQQTIASPGEVTQYSRRNVGCVKASSRSLAFRKKHYPEISRFDWNDWQWQVRNRIRTVEQVSRFVKLSDDERTALNAKNSGLPLGITPYYATLLDRDNPLQAVRRTVIPVADELVFSAGEARDPLGEDHNSPVPGIVHRYPDRVLFLVSAFCSVYCRYCTRSRVVGNFSEYHFSRKQWDCALEYIERTPQVRDVLLSGGDPLDLSDDRLDYLLGRLRAIKHVEFVRIGTKVPVVLPQRVTMHLVKVLKRHNPLWMSIHFTHPDELTPETAEACARLADAGIPLGSQTVLLKGVNDSVETMKALFHGLLRNRVKPYYLYQCDPIQGSEHFRTAVSKGLEIIEGLRGHTTGYAVPHYVIDAPGGGGKIALLPDAVVGREGDYLLLRNYEGRTYRYHNPA